MPNASQRGHLPTQRSDSASQAVQAKAAARLATARPRQQPAKQLPNTAAGREDHVADGRWSHRQDRLDPPAARPAGAQGVVEALAGAGVAGAFVAGAFVAGAFVAGVAGGVWEALGEGEADNSASGTASTGTSRVTLPAR